MLIPESNRANQNYPFFFNAFSCVPRAPMKTCCLAIEAHSIYTLGSLFWNLLNEPFSHQLMRRLTRIADGFCRLFQ
jgi:hypothetical protein